MYDAFECTANDVSPSVVIDKAQIPQDRFFTSRGTGLVECPFKPAFHDVDTDIDIDILAMMSAKMSVSVSWNAGFKPHVDHFECPTCVMPITNTPES